MKKILSSCFVGLLIVIMFIGTPAITPKAEASSGDLDFEQLINLLVLVGVIEEQKAQEFIDFLNLINNEDGGYSNESNYKEESDDDYDNKNYIGQEEKLEIVITSPQDGKKVKRQTPFEWTWGWNSLRSEKVDIFIEGKNDIWEMVTEYPNSGSFWWNAGADLGGWNEGIPNGQYEMIVCPSDKKITSNYCDSFTFELYGEMAEVTLRKPVNGEIFKSGEEIQIEIGDMNKGDKYQIQFEIPAKVSGIVASEKEVTAQRDGTNSYSLQLPNNLNDGDHAIYVFQRTLEGSPCTNYACARDGVIVNIRN